jgi:hypothetical protein
LNEVEGSAFRRRANRSRIIQPGEAREPAVASRSKGSSSLTSKNSRFGRNDKPENNALLAPSSK